MYAMNAKFSLPFLVCALLILGCNKTNVDPNGLVGSWKIYQIDSSYIVPSDDDPHWILLEEIPTDGIIHFYGDSSGLYEIEDRFSCGIGNFLWSLNKTNDTLSFTYSSITDIAIIYTLNKDSMEFRRGTCTGPQGTGYGLSYLFKTKRTIN